MSRHEFFTVSFQPDAIWLKALLRSVERFTSGFAALNLLVPDTDEKLFRDLIKEGLTKLPINLHTHRVPAGKGYLAQIKQKFYADRWCPEAKYIWFIDSDCIFTRPVDPSFLVKEGEVGVMAEPFEKFRYGPPWHWFDPTRKMLGWPPRWETMRTFPICLHRLVFEACRGHVANTVGQPFEQYLMNGSPGPAGCDRTDFNVLGNFALRVYPNQHVNIPPDGTRLFQCWSWGGVDRPLEWRDDATFPYALPVEFRNRNPRPTPREIFREFLKLEL